MVVIRIATRNIGGVVGNSPVSTPPRKKMSSNPSSTLPSPVSTSEQGDGKVPFSQKMSYGAGGWVDHTNMQMLQMLAMLVFVVDLGVSPAYLGVIFTFQRLWDSVSDPLMGHITDNFRSRWGRRRLFILIGGIATAVFYSAIWMFPEGKTVVWYQVYLAVGAFLYMTAHTVFSVPYQALGCEMTRDYHERTSIMSYRTIIGHVGWLYAVWIYYMVNLGAERGIFGGVSEGLKYVTGTFGLLSIAIVIYCSVVTKERFYHQVTKEKGKVKFLEAFKNCLSNKPFLFLMGLNFFSMFTQILVANLQSLLNIFYMAGAAKKTGALYSAIFGSVIMISSIIAIPIISKLSVKYGKKEVLIGCIALQLLGASSKWFLFNPDLPYLQNIVALLQGPGMAGTLVLVGSMITDICDLDELKHGHRREAMFVSIASWIVKIGMTTAVFLSGFLAVWIGYEAGADTQKMSVMITMKACFAFMPALGALVAIICIWKYPLNQKRVMEIRVALDERGAA